MQDGAILILGGAARTGSWFAQLFKKGMGGGGLGRAGVWRLPNAWVCTMPII